MGVVWTSLHHVFRVPGCTNLGSLEAVIALVPARLPGTVNLLVLRSACPRGECRSG